ncbi:MAG: hypothetical protein QM621_10205 [Aeromicrobium sp.]|uniref:hypothetical protein n=1 Tax=Aeromicrobium sp. TaxID=1871063 RepID=UPI0039E62448
MNSWVVKSVAAVVMCVAIVAIALGLNSPDGSVRDDDAPNTVASDDPKPTPSAEPATEDEAEPEPEATPEPTSTSPAAGLWPGRPAAATENGGVVDWCPAVQVEVSASARSAVGDEAARQAACRAIAFTFDVRYSRLSLPRQSYTAADFAPVEAFLTDHARTSVYPPRVDAVIASPRDRAAREGTGVVLLDGPGAGAGRSYFGPAWSDAGYANGAWIHPTWSTISVDLDRGGSRPRLAVSFTASADLPVRAPDGSTELLTVDTDATYIMVGGPDWKINGWTLQTSSHGYTPMR